MIMYVGVSSSFGKGTFLQKKIENFVQCNLFYIENLQTPFFYDIMRLQSKLNTVFNLSQKEVRAMRTLNSITLNAMEKYIITYQKEQGKSPSYREIMHALSMSSLNLVQRYVLALEKAGKIERTRLGSISVMPKLKPSGFTLAPLVGSIACGQPVDAVENIEGTFALPKAIFGNGNLFMLRAKGDSMIDAGIKDDDLIVIRQQNTAENGEIVVAMINGETTLKRLYKRNGKVVLHPENKAMKDIVVKHCDIQGVLISCIKMYE